MTASRIPKLTLYWAQLYARGPHGHGGSTADRLSEALIMCSVKVDASPRNHRNLQPGLLETGLLVLGQGTSSAMAVAPSYRGVIGPDPP